MIQIDTIRELAKAADMQGLSTEFYDLLADRAAFREDANRLRADLAAANAVIDELREDAERFAWLAAHCRSTAEHWSGRWSIVIEGPAPTRHDDEDAFRSAIDAARATPKGTT